jgi:hypothetical protein
MHRKRTPGPAPVFPPAVSTVQGFVLRSVTPILAHGFGGSNGLPLPRWLLAYGIGFAVVTTFVVLRITQPQPAAPKEAAVTDEPPRGPLFATTRAIGLLALVAIFVTAAVGKDDASANVAPVTVIVLFFLGWQVVSVVAGDLFWWFNPFDTLARGSRRSEASTDTPDPHWTAAAFLFAFVWFVFAYPEFYPPRPHEIAWFLAVYTIAVVAGAAVWGRAWVRDGEGFGALFGLLGRRRARPATNGTVALLCVYLGAILFDAVSQTNWWVDVLGTSRGWSERVINTVGLVWAVAGVAVVYVAAAAVTARLIGRRTAEISGMFAPVLVPLGFAWSFAHYLNGFLADAQNFVALISDPLGRGWNLFGTINNVVNYRWLTPNQSGSIQAVALLVGCVVSAVRVHRAAFMSFRGERAVWARYPLGAALVAGAVGAVTLLLGT